MRFTKMTERQPGKSGSVLFAVTIFTSAFLLFQVQPLLAKFILPWFGGTPAVWTMCMLVFQMLLFGGYAYAHLLSCIKSVSRQACIHAALLAVAALTLPIVPGVDWKPVGDESARPANHAAAAGHRGRALLSAVLHRTAAAKMVQHGMSAVIAVSPVCPVQHRIVTGTGLLPICL